MQRVDLPGCHAYQDLGLSNLQEYGTLLLSQRNVGNDIDRITHPIADLTGYITEGQIVLSRELHRKGILKRHKVEFLGTDAEAIDVAESREKFNRLMERIGIPILPGKVVKDIESAVGFAKSIGYPLIIRPSFTLGGTGGGTSGRAASAG